ncbi:MAG TPA: hypothetical protein PLA69_10525 [Flavobacterium sp.]|nr:hypothetical protein [Flavobacterium sp.]
MRILLLILMLSTMASAQDLGGTSFSIPAVPRPAVSSPSPAPEPEKAPSIFDPVPRATGSIEEPELNTAFSNPPQFANPADRYTDKMNKKATGDNEVAIRKNLYLGDVRTGSKSARIVYRDHEYPDGDLIRIWVNDRVVRNSILLEAEFQGLDLPLEPGFNKVEFEALNQGTSGPNTAQFQVYDDQGKLITNKRWNLATGFKASIIIVKE